LGEFVAALQFSKVAVDGEQSLVEEIDVEEEGMAHGHLQDEMVVVVHEGGEDSEVLAEPPEYGLGDQPQQEAVLGEAEESVMEDELDFEELVHLLHNKLAVLLGLAELLLRIHRLYIVLADVVQLQEVLVVPQDAR
jgi:hypothetical protein